MNIAVCDDLDCDRKEIENILLEDARHQIYTYKTMEELLQAEIHFDLLFLDIEIPGGITGLEAAIKIRQKDRNIMIVFVTNHANKVYEAIPIEIMGFLQKPIQEKEINKVLRQCETKYEWNNYMVFNDQFLGKIHEHIALRVQDIYYIASERNYTEIYHRLSPEPFRWKMALHKIEKQLKDCRSFCRCQRSFIVNLQYVLRLYQEKDYKYWALLEDDKFRAQIPISRDKWDIVNELFYNYRRGYR